jgi:ACS family hexuronate transporter-like MFS transporter
MQNTLATDRPLKSRYRWTICGLLFWVTTANYIDRSVFSNLAPELQKIFGWSTQDYWTMTMVFQAAYALSLVISGSLIDKLGLRLGFTLAVAFWGLASLSHSLVTGIAGFFVVRTLLGLGEGGNFPACIKTIAEWFPKSERALATGLFNSGSNLGGLLVPIAIATLLPVLSRMSIGGHIIGWRGAFICNGIIDLAWIIAWLAIYKRPEDHPKVSAEELAYIRSEPTEPTVKIPWRRLLPHRQTWAFAVAKGMTDCMWWFYLFGTPLFFADRFHMNASQRAVPVACIYIFSSVGSIAGGWLSGRLMKQGLSTNYARKMTMGICALVVMPVFFAAITGSAWVAAGLITLAACGHQAWSANAFNLSSDMFPRRVVGSVVGLGGMVGSVVGIFFSAYVGKVLGASSTHYLPIFLAPTLSYPLALLIIHLLVPRLEPVRIEEVAAAPA